MRLAVLVLIAGCDKLLGLTPANVPPTPDAPPDALPPGNWAAVAAGADHTCAIDGAGAVWCWGRNASGELGIGVGALESGDAMRAGGGNAIAIAGADSTVCAIHDDRTLWCWGYNGYYELGPGWPLVMPGLPVQIPGSWTQVSAHADHVCGIQSDASLWCWGNNSYGELGAPSANPSAMPVKVMGTWAQVSAGDDFTCGVQTDGSLWCWGHGDFSELGNGSLLARMVPTPVAFGGTYTMVATGGDHACALRNDGHLRCWGDNFYGELGDLTTTTRVLPVAVGDDASDWTSVAAGSRHTCATRRDGTLWCWGDNSHGQLAVPRAPGLSSAPLQIDVGHVDFIAVSGGGEHTCALSADHNLWCAGADSWSQLGDHPIHRSPLEVAGGPWHAPVAGTHDSCALDAANALWCWGDDAYYQLGDGSRSPRTSPQKVDDAARTNVTLGAGAVCELRAGARWCWGDNSASEFGDGSTTASALPELIISPILSNPTTWQNVHINQASAYVGDLTHACSIDPTNALYCWGDNLAHESNYGINGTPLSAPSKVNISGTVTSVSVGVGFTCAIANTTLGCWGRNVFNELGDGTSNDATSPVAPGLPSGYVPVSVVSGSLDSCVLDAGGHAVCWGPNFKGEAGGGSTMAASKPVAIAHTWQSISVGEVHACGIGLDHTLWCWGSDERGQLGDGKQDNTYAPQQVGTDTDWSEVACGYAHSCATKSDGRLFCWGDSSLGELGDGRGWRASLAIVPAP